MAIERWLTLRAQNWSREMPQVENDKIVETATEARGAVTGQNVNYVLLISTIAVIVLFVAAYLLTKG
jgi:CHASE3 domain sensor protein